MTRAEKQELLLRVRKKTFAPMSQEEFARALHVSLPTVARWEGGSVEVPDDTAQMLHCLIAFVDEERRQKDLKVDEIKQAMLQTGVVGVLSSAAATRRLPPALLAALAAIPVFGWVGAIAIGAVPLAVALPYFRKLVQGKKGSTRQT